MLLNIDHYKFKYFVIFQVNDVHINSWIVKVFNFDCRQCQLKFFFSVNFTPEGKTQINPISEEFQYPLNQNLQFK